MVNRAISAALQKFKGTDVAARVMSVLASPVAETLNEGWEEVASDLINPLWEKIITGHRDEIELQQLAEDWIVGVALGGMGRAGEYVTGRATGQSVTLDDGEPRGFYAEEDVTAPDAGETATVAPAAENLTPAQNAGVEAQKNAPEEAMSSRRLTDADLPDYLKAGTRRNINKNSLLESGKNIILTTTQAIQNYIKSAIQGNESGRTVAYGRVNQRLANEVSGQSKGKIDIADAYLEFVPDDLQHSYEQHSVAKEQGDIPLTEDDYLNLPDYLDNYDDLIYAIQYPSGKTNICVGKHLSNGKIVIIETASKSRGALQFKNAIGVSDSKYQSNYLDEYVKDRSNTRGSESSNISLRDETVSTDSISDSSPVVKWKNRDLVHDNNAAEQARMDVLRSVAQDIRDGAPLAEKARASEAARSELYGVQDERQRYALLRLNQLETTLYQMAADDPAEAEVSIAAIFRNDYGMTLDEALDDGEPRGLHEEPPVEGEEVDDGPRYLGSDSQAVMEDVARMRAAQAKGNYPLQDKPVRGTMRQTNETGGVYDDRAGAEGTERAYRGVSRKESESAVRRESESNGGFLHRMAQSGCTVREAGGFRYGFKPVPVNEQSANAREIANELKALGIDAFVYESELQANNGKTTLFARGDAHTLKDGSVAIPNSADGILSAKEIAGHEAAHSMLDQSIPQALAFKEAVNTNLDLGSNSTREYIAAVVRQYFGDDLDISNGMHKERLLDELCAYISGQLCGNSMDISAMFHDFDAVRSAWQAMINTARRRANAKRYPHLYTAMVQELAEEALPMLSPSQRARLKAWNEDFPEMRMSEEEFLRR